MGFSQHEYHKKVGDSYGVGMIKEWVATSDTRTRTSHMIANGTKVSMDEDFTVGGSPMKYAGDPRGGASNVINCRCVIVYVDAEDALEDDDALEEKPVQDFETLPDYDPDKKPYIDGIEDVADSPRSGRRYQKELNLRLSNVTAQVASQLPRPRRVSSGKGKYFYTYNELMTPYSFDNKFGQPIDKDGKLGKEIKKLNGTLEHEYGHHVDYALGMKETGLSGTSISPKIFEKSLKQERSKLAFGLTTSTTNFSILDRNLKKITGEIYEKSKVRTKDDLIIEEYIPKFEGATLVSDIVDALTRGYYQDKFYAWGHGQKYYRRKNIDAEEIFANLFGLSAPDKTEARDYLNKNFPELTKAFDGVMLEFARTGKIKLPEKEDS
jgi:hypothetical protein